MEWLMLLLLLATVSARVDRYLPPDSSGRTIAAVEDDPRVDESKLAARKEDSSGADDGNSAPSLQELLKLWGIDESTGAATTTPRSQRGDIEVSEASGEPSIRGDVPGGARRLLWTANSRDRWYGENEGLLPGDGPSEERANRQQHIKQPHRVHRHRDEPTERPEGTYEERLAKWHKMKEEHDRLVQQRKNQARPPPPSSDNEQELERKLQDYIRRNTPIVVGPAQSSRQAMERRRNEEEQDRREEQRRRANSERRGPNRGVSRVHPREEEERRHAGRNQQRKQDAHSDRYAEFRRNEDSSRPEQPRRSQSKDEETRRLQQSPVAAQIIIRQQPPSNSSAASAAAPHSRLSESGEIDFPGLSPNRRGLDAPGFPVPPTKRPPANSPEPCVWALVVCCKNAREPSRLPRCFEATNCPTFDALTYCEPETVSAANNEIMRFYLQAVAPPSAPKQIIFS